MQGVDTALALGALPFGPVLSAVLSILGTSITMVMVIYGAFDGGQGLLKYTFQHYFLSPHSHFTKTVLFFTLQPRNLRLVMTQGLKSTLPPSELTHLTVLLYSLSMSRTVMLQILQTLRESCVPSLIIQTQIICMPERRVHVGWGACHK